jgi:hypothetical protein
MGTTTIFNLKYTCMNKLILVALLFLISCKKQVQENINESLPTGTTLANGSFVSDVHPTSGTVKVNQDVSGKLQLVFENFKTDSGPDLKVWLSPNINGSPYQEVGVLKAISGNFSYTIDANINYTTNNRVLIWCEDFSVLFGHAVLK